MTIKYTKQEQIAIDTAKAIVAVGTAQAGIDTNCQALHKLLKGKKLGTVKNGDAVMIRFTETLEKAGKAEHGLFFNIPELGADRSGAGLRPL